MTVLVSRERKSVTDQSVKIESEKADQTDAPPYALILLPGTGVGITRAKGSRGNGNEYQVTLYRVEARGG